MKYCVALPPKGPPGFRLQRSTHFLPDSPLTGSSKRSGHSQTPSCAPRPRPKLLSRVQSFMSGEEKISISWSRAWASTRIQTLRSAPQNIFGSRASLSSVSTGLPSYFVKVSPLSSLQARLWIWLAAAEVYIATTASLPKPALPLRSTAELPLNIIPRPSGSITASGRCSQWIRSRLTECPHERFCHFEP